REAEERTSRGAARLRDRRCDVQQQSITPAGAWSLDRRALLSNVPFAVALRPPPPPRSDAGLSGRPTCRIYARGDVWILEIDCASGGWLIGGDNAGRRLVFPNLAARSATGWIIGSNGHGNISAGNDRKGGCRDRGSHTSHEMDAKEISIMVDFKALLPWGDKSKTP